MIKQKQIDTDFQRHLLLKHMAMQFFFSIGFQLLFMDTLRLFCELSIQFVRFLGRVFLQDFVSHDRDCTEKNGTLTKSLFQITEIFNF